jgi:hypothetical protein
MENTLSTRTLIKQSRKERERLSRQVEQGQKTIARLQETLAEIDAVLERASESKDAA